MNISRLHTTTKMQTCLKIKTFEFIFKFWFILIVFSLLGADVKSQCDDKLVEKAIENSGADALFLRDFKIKQTKRKILRSSGVNYEVHLQKGLIYRFLVENEKHSKTTGFLNLYDGDLELGSSYNLENKKDEKSFDFLCEESKPYQIVMSFIDSEQACAVGIMSLVVTDSVSMNQIVEQNEIENELYIGIDNFIDIAVTDNPKGTIEVKASRGRLKRAQGLYQLNLDKEGPVTIEAIAKDSLGNVKESVKSTFIAKTPMLPNISINGITGGLISKKNILQSTPKVELQQTNNNLNFKLLEFAVSETLVGNGIKISRSQYFSGSQLKFIKELRNGETFYITDILVENQFGTKYRLESTGFIIVDANSKSNLPNSGIHDRKMR